MFGFMNVDRVDMGVAALIPCACVIGWCMFLHKSWLQHAPFSEGLLMRGWLPFYLDKISLASIQFLENIISGKDSIEWWMLYQKDWVFSTF
jgi:hypothetical protein